MDQCSVVMGEYKGGEHEQGKVFRHPLCVFSIHGEAVLFADKVRKLAGTTLGTSVEVEGVPIPGGRELLEVYTVVTSTSDIIRQTPVRLRCLTSFQKSSLVALDADSRLWWFDLSTREWAVRSDVPKPPQSRGSKLDAG